MQHSNAKIEIVPSQMLAVVLSGPGGDYAIQVVPVPPPGRMEVLCRVDSAYICGTDPHIIQGQYPGFWPTAYPFIPGHEWAGTIVALGDDVEGFGWRIGDRVAGTSHCGCGYCRMCTSGRYNLCLNYGREDLGHRQYGHYTQGAFAEFVVHSVKSVFKVPDELSLEEAAGLDPASIALHTIKRASLRPGDDVAILGPGPMGLLVLQCALALGAGRILVVGRGDRLDRAAQLGATIVDYSREDPIAQVRSLTEGEGASVVVDCAGTPRSLGQAVEMVGRGGHISVIGIPFEPATLPVQRLVLNEIDIYGVRANRGTCEEVLPLMVAGKVRVGLLHTHTYPMTRFSEALETFISRKGGALKVMLKPGQ
ncbi:MAG: zinc-dependent alcohol dehydrogenase [Chloroflexota bacterium]